MKLITIILMFLSFLGGHSQNDNVVFYRDDTTQKLTASRSLVITPRNPEFQIYSDGTKDGKRVLGLWLQILGDGKCNADNKLILLFMRGQRIVLKSNSVMNCRGLIYFPLQKEDKETLKNYRLFKIRLINGRNRNYKNRIKDGYVSVNDMDYFIQRFYASENTIFSNTD